MPMTFQPRVRLQTQTGLAVGFEAGKTKATAATGSDDVFIGYLAGRAAPDGQTFHTFVGSYAGAAVVTGAGSTFLGQKAGISTTSAQSSVAVGSKAAVNALSLMDDTFVGYAAGGSVTAINLGRRTFVGVGAGDRDCGDYNIYLGWKAGKQDSVNDAMNSWGNIGIGAQSLNAVTGFGNVAAGHFAGNSIAGGTGNVAVGYRSGQLLTVGSNNVLVGYEAGLGHTNTARCIFLGEHAGNTVPNGSQNVFVAGSGASAGGARIDNVFFGKGYAHATPTAYTINGTGGSGENIAGADVKLAGGKGTGSAGGGSVVLQVAPAGSAGPTFNLLVDAVTVRSSDLQARFGGAIVFKPGSSVTPASNNEVTIEKTSDTLLTFKVRGNDGVLRTGTIAVAA